MAHGGKRPGAGRKPGAANRMNEQARKEAMKGGITPLDFLLAAMRDEGKDFATRMDAAKAAAPYIHARLSSVEQKTTITERNVVRVPEPAVSVEDWKARVERRH